MQPDLQNLLQRIEALERQIAQPPNVNLDTQLIGLFEVVSAVPTGIPRTPYEQIKIYTNSTTYRLYWYDWNAHAWHYATGT